LRREGILDNPFLADNLDILSQLPHRLFAAQPRGRLSSRLHLHPRSSAIIHGFIAP